eukprot:TRINITY_DN49763_c0_g1_i1.p1 TRINITY_DN49763_c0_g1~~TRINITY_DN49763_c0_g1_i1.p1  ORF type:complete len:239 (+),score=21.99 TRINITY_DN49763_c0_g1_i1:26-718(+)
MMVANIFNSTGYPSYPPLEKTDDLRTSCGFQISRGHFSPREQSPRGPEVHKTLGAFGILPGIGDVARRSPGACAQSGHKDQLTRYQPTDAAARAELQHQTQPIRHRSSDIGTVGKRGTGQFSPRAKPRADAGVSFASLHIQPEARASWRPPWGSGPGLSSKRPEYRANESREERRELRRQAATSPMSNQPRPVRRNSGPPGGLARRNSAQKPEVSIEESVEVVVIETQTP